MKKMMKKMMSGGMKPKSKMGFKEDAGQKFLMKMTKGGMLDMSEMGNMMKAGYGTQVNKMGMMKKGGQTKLPVRGARMGTHISKKKS